MTIRNDLRIVDVRAIPLERKLERVYQGGTYEITSRYTLVTEVVLENGVTGCMFGGDETNYQKAIAALINGEFRSMLVGQELPNLERMWTMMFECTALQSRNRSIHTPS